MDQKLGRLVDLTKMLQYRKGPAEPGEGPAQLFWACFGRCGSCQLGKHEDTLAPNIGGFRLGFPTRTFFQVKIYMQP